MGRGRWILRINILSLFTSACTVLHQNEETDTPPFEVTLFHYLAWPDHGVPANAISMVNFIKRVRKAHPYSRQDLLLVHCSAGVGRTGTFITLDSMMERIKTEDSINIFEFVSNLRKQRVLMVQTSVSLMHEMVQLLTESEVQNMCTTNRCFAGRPVAYILIHSICFLRDHLQMKSFQQSIKCYYRT